MKPLVSIVCLCIFPFLACGNGDGSPVRVLNRYGDTPGFIKSFLDSAHGGHFSIAEKGARWNGGCVMSTALPNRKFISAMVRSGQYQLHFLTGGFAASRHTIIVGFAKERVLQYSVD